MPPGTTPVAQNTSSVPRPLFQSQSSSAFATYPMFVPASVLAATRASYTAVRPNAAKKAMDLRGEKQQFIPLVKLYQQGTYSGPGESQATMKQLKRSIKEERRVSGTSSLGEQQVSVEKLPGKALAVGILVKLPKVPGNKPQYILNPEYNFVY